MEAVSHPMYWLGFLLVAHFLCLSALRVLGALADFSIRRHDLIRESRHVRSAYIQSLRERHLGVDVVDDEDEQGDVVEVGPVEAGGGAGVVATVGPVDGGGEAGTRQAA